MLGAKVVLPSKILVISVIYLLYLTVNYFFGVIVPLYDFYNVKFHLLPPTALNLQSQ